MSGQLGKHRYKNICAFLGYRDFCVGVFYFGSHCTYMASHELWYRLRDRLAKARLPAATFLFVGVEHSHLAITALLIPRVVAHVSTAP